MRKTAVFISIAVCAALVISALPAYAPDIRGVSFRATEEMPPGTERGTADIIASGGQYELRADFTRVSGDLFLDDFDADAWVIWAVQPDGTEVNVGSLNEDLVLETATVDFFPAGLIMSAESSADAAEREGPALFRVTLRETTQGDDDDATPEASPTAEPTEEPADTTDDDADAEDEEPEDLPTTGFPFRDLAILAGLAFVLLMGGLQLRRAGA